MGIKHGSESAYTQERRKWETQPVMIDPQWIAPHRNDAGDLVPGYMDGTYIQPIARSEGGRYPYTFQEFPKMLYRAGRPTGTTVAIVQSRIVHDETEQRQAQGQGFAVSQEAAIEAVHATDQELAVQAANRHFHERRMSEHAQAEVAVVEAQSSAHLGEIPETPIRRRHRKKPVEAHA